MTASLLYLSRADVESLALPVSDVVDAVEESFRRRGLREAQLPPKIGVTGAGGAFAHAMPAAVPAAGALGVKWVAAFPGNPALGLPTISGLVVLSDPRTGLPLAVMEAALITAMRTGASAAVAARHLCAPGAETIGVLGCGVQGRSSVRALATVLPRLRRVQCHDLVPGAARAFAAELAAEMPAVEFDVAGAPAAVAAGASLVLTAISMVDGVPPPLGGGLLERGGLAVALDYDAAWSAAAMAECERFVCDDRESTLATRAQGAHLAGIPAIDADLGEIAAGLRPGREREDARIFCMNLGIATHDVITARLAYDRARAAGVGTELPL
jgi:ornithine cyclodeaminase/alanine dehydrogenase